jgi:hypothetical protein
MPRSWCNFCEKHNEESTCEVKKSVRDKIFGKRPETTIVVLDFTELEDVMITITRNNSYASKEKYDPPRTSTSPSSRSHQLLLYKLLKPPTVKELPPLFPLRYTTFSINWLISRPMLLFWTWLSSLNNKSI